MVVAAVALVAWRVLDGYLTRRAFAAHLEQGTAYAARILEQVGTLPDELRESSGLVVSRTQPGVLWSHNDSGDGPTLYALDPSGRLLASVPVGSATAWDWEDIAAGPCPAGWSEVAGGAATACLYVADTGNNNRGRDEFTVYVVEEPIVGGSGAPGRPAAARSFRYRYPDQPYDAEALAVLPDGDLTIVSKGWSGAIDFFGFSGADVARALASGEVLAAEPRGNTGIEPSSRIGRLATGAAVSPDGMTLALRTYTEVFFYAAVSDAEGRRWRDLRRPCFLGDAEPQGEGIDYLDEDTLLLTSERRGGRPASIHRLECDRGRS